MKIPAISPELIDGLRSRFHPKDRSVYLAADCFVYFNNNAALSNAFISEIILSASAASVTFSNIPQGFRQLMLYCRTRSDAVAENDTIGVRFNGDSTAIYDYEQLVGSGATPASAAGRAQTSMALLLAEAANSRGNAFAGGVLMIPGFSTAGQEKAILSLGMAFGNVSADTDCKAFLATGQWRKTDVITSLTLILSTGPNFVSGSRFQLYGVV